MLTFNIATDFMIGVAVGLFLGLALYGTLILLIKKFSKSRDKDSN